MFPLYASAGLFALYLFFRYLSKDYVNLLLSIYFFGLGVGALTRVTRLVAMVMSASIICYYGSILAEFILPSSILTPLVSYCLFLEQRRHGNKEGVSHYYMGKLLL